MNVLAFYKIEWQSRQSRWGRHVKAESSFSVNPVDYRVYLTNQGMFKREKKSEIEASGQWVLGTFILCESHENKNKNQNAGLRYYQ